MLWSPSAEDTFRKLRRFMVMHPRDRIRAVHFEYGSSVILSLRTEGHYPAMTPGYQELMVDEGEEVLIYKGRAYPRSTNIQPYYTSMSGTGRSSAEKEVANYRRGIVTTQALQDLCRQRDRLLKQFAQGVMR